jgi:hypothetical protein
VTSAIPTRYPWAAVNSRGWCRQRYTSLLVYNNIGIRLIRRGSMHKSSINMQNADSPNSDFDELKVFSISFLVPILVKMLIVFYLFYYLFIFEG